MLYELFPLAVILVVAFDLSIGVMLIRLMRQPRRSAEKWAPILGVVFLFLPLCGYKLLFSSPGTAASTPGLVTVLNPAQRFERVYYLERQQSGTEEVSWVSYLLTTTDSVIFETEGSSGLQAAVYQAGQWHYAPVQFGEKYAALLTLPQSFTAVDHAGRIERAVAAYRVTEYANLFSNLLTIATAALLGAIVIRRFAGGHRRAN